MGNVTSLPDNIDFSDVMTTGDTAKLLHRSGETVRKLTERSRHPLPCVDTGMGKRRQRLFRRTAVLRWMVEEEQASDIRATGKQS